MDIIRKQYLDQLIKKKDNGRIKIITGIRRCGKSYLLFQLYRRYLLESGVMSSHIIEMPLDEIGTRSNSTPISRAESEMPPSDIMFL